jgi:hypothetical protein
MKSDSMTNQVRRLRHDRKNQFQKRRNSIEIKNTHEMERGLQ